MTPPFRNTLCSAVMAAGTFSLSGFAFAQAPQSSRPDAPPKVVAAETDPDVAVARKAALAWLALADASKFEATWDEAATSFQKVQKKVDWVKALSGARPVVGKVVTRTFLNFEIRNTLPNLPPAKYITVRFTTVFEKHNRGAESVTLIRDGARGFRMMSYYLE